MPPIEEVIGYNFRDKDLLRTALTHKSYAAEKNSAECNERLEFLGDSVLGLAVARYLYGEHPGRDEGHLSKLKSFLVSRQNLAVWARAINLGEHLLLGVGEAQTGGKKRTSILANSLEALLAAVYLDGGMAEAERLVLGWLSSSKPEEPEADHKSRLQEMIQKKHHRTPEYEIIRSEGPEHDKNFTVNVRLGRKVLGMGAGKNKKEAQQAAARNALDYLEHNELGRDEI